jgi:hypothetical protein
MQMFLAAMLIDAFHATLENTVEPFKRVGMDLATSVLARAVIDILMARELFA